jgi:hypothetical protein
MNRNNRTASAAVALLTAVLIGTATAPTLAQDMKMPAGQKMDMKPSKPISGLKYKAHCGKIYSAADAKKYHYICPMDHKKLTKIVASKPAMKKM